MKAEFSLANPTSEQEKRILASLDVPHGSASKDFSARGGRVKSMKKTRKEKASGGYYLSVQDFKG